MKIFSRIIELLDKNEIQYVSKRHAPTLTSLDSARERGEPLKIGAKALLVKTDKEFILAVLPADRRLDIVNVLGFRISFHTFTNSNCEQMHEMKQRLHFSTEIK